MLQMASSFNHLVTPENQCRRYVETNRLGGFEINREYKFRWLLLDGNVGWRNAVASTSRSACSTPRSVISLFTSRAGVTSKP
jgi:hypothetical protein